jgi:hypothetical protein
LTAAERRGSIPPVTEATTIGERFANALAAKDAGAIRALLHPQVDFRGLTPNRQWEAAGPDAVLDVLLGSWFEDKDEIRTLDAFDTGAVGDRVRVGYRFTVENADGRHVVEQQAFLTERDERIDWMRVLCSGFRPDG